MGARVKPYRGGLRLSKPRRRGGFSSGGAKPTPSYSIAGVLLATTRVDVSRVHTGSHVAFVTAEQAGGYGADKVLIEEAMRLETPLPDDDLSIAVCGDDPTVEPTAPERIGLVTLKNCADLLGVAKVSPQSGGY